MNVMALICLCSCMYMYPFNYLFILTILFSILYIDLFIFFFSLCSFAPICFHQLISVFPFTLLLLFELSCRSEKKKLSTVRQMDLKK